MSLERIEQRTRAEQAAELERVISDTARGILQNPHLDARRLRALMGAMVQIGMGMALGVPAAKVVPTQELIALVACKPWDLPA